MCWPLGSAHLGLCREAQPGETKMLSKTVVTLAGAIVLSTALSASAATKHHHRVTHVHPAIYDMVVPAAVGGGCPANGGPGCSNAGPAPPDSW
jgi:hypothetical protein